MTKKKRTDDSHFHPPAEESGVFIRHELPLDLAAEFDGPEEDLPKWYFQTILHGINTNLDVVVAMAELRCFEVFKEHAKDNWHPALKKYLTLFREPERCELKVADDFEFLLFDGYVSALFNTRLPRDLPADTRHQLADAAQCLAGIYMVRRYLKAGDCEKAALVAWRAGQAGVRLGVRPFERHTRQVERTYGKLQAGYVSFRGGRSADDKKTEATNRLQEILAQNPKMRRTEAKQLVARQLGVSLRTVHRYLEDEMRRKK